MLAVVAGALVTPTLSAVPEVTGLRWCPGQRDCLEWTAVTGAVEYGLYRGEGASLPCVLNPSLDSCDDGSFATTTTGPTISENPAAGTMFWFLVVARDGSTEGSAGAGSAGPRSVNSSGSCGPACAPAGTACASNNDCCSANCDGVCQTSCCLFEGALCSTHAECCNGACVGGACSGPCTVAEECPGADSECTSRTCIAGVCGLAYAPDGTPVSNQVAGDCQTSVCDGVGGSVSVNDDTDVPIDGNECTNDTCVNGVPGNPPAPVGQPCSQSGGTECDGLGNCVSSPVPPEVVSTSPADGSSVPAGQSVAVTFSQAMNPATLTGQTSAGACMGSIQVSIDEFTSCIAFASSGASMSGGDTVATFVPSPGLLVHRAFRIRVTTAAQSAAGLALQSTYTQATGFTTTSPDLCDGSLVISQVYGGGGLAGAAFRNDYVELHNRGTAAMDINGMSIQYASATGTTWTVVDLSGVVPAGGFYLVQLGSGGTNGSPLPAPDLSVDVDISATTGKLALVSSGTALAGSCPTGTEILDFIGYGASADCNEGGANAPAASAGTADLRLLNGCLDTNANATDFVAGTGTPRNTASPASGCACVALNESDTPAEADYCVVQFPSSLVIPPGASTGMIYGQIYESGVTEPPGAPPDVLAQLGYGPVTANPQYQAGWTWYPASYNVQSGNNDEYMAQFTPAGVGSYRYVYRFSRDSGLSWTYCDTVVADGGAGSNPGLNFDIENQGTLTVTP